MGLFRRRFKPVLVRHVGWTENGVGATLTLLDDGTRHTWQWVYDKGIDPDDLGSVLAVERAITEIESAGGLPLTFPYMDASYEPPKHHGVRRSAGAEDVDPNDPHAQVRAWRATGTPVASPDDLVRGTTYIFGADLAVYVGSFEGEKWEGTDVVDEVGVGPHGTWFMFSPAESTQPGSGRMGQQAFQPRFYDSEPYYPWCQSPPRPKT